MVIELTITQLSGSKLEYEPSAKWTGEASPPTTAPSGWLMNVVCTPMAEP